MSRSVTSSSGAPGRDVGIVAERHRGHLGMGLRHAAGHRAAHAAQGLQRPDLVQDAGHALDVGYRDGVVGAARGDDPEVHVQAMGQGPHGRGGLGPDDCAARGPTHGGGRFPQDLAPRGDLTDYRAGIGGRRPFGIELDNRIAGVQDVAGLTVEAQDAPALRARDVHDGLGGLDRDQRLIGLDLVTRLDVPLYDLGLGEPLTEIGELEEPH